MNGVGVFCLLNHGLFTKCLFDCISYIALMKTVIGEDEVRGHMKAGNRCLVQNRSPIRDLCEKTEKKQEKS